MLRPWHWRPDTLHNDIQHKDTQHNETQHINKKSDSKMILSITTFSIAARVTVMLCVVLLSAAKKPIKLCVARRSVVRLSVVAPRKW